MPERYLEIKENDSYHNTNSLITLIHEIVHLWVGDLMTCQNWGDLFLHEAFANFVSWIIFYDSSKLNKYS